jgi:hypothetical protein
MRKSVSLVSGLFLVCCFCAFASPAGRNVALSQTATGDSLLGLHLTGEENRPFWNNPFYYSRESSANDHWMFLLYFLGSEVVATAAHFLPQYGLAKAFGARDVELNFLPQSRSGGLWIEFFRYDPASVSKAQNVAISTIGFGMNQLIYELIV